MTYSDYDVQDLRGQDYQLPQLAELEVDDITHTTLITLINYIQILESNQKELIKMINAIVTELPEKLNQKVEKYMKAYQDNIINKQLNEINEVSDNLYKYIVKKQKNQKIDMDDLQQRVNKLQQVLDKQQMSQVFNDVKEIKSMLLQLRDSKSFDNQQDQDQNSQDY